MNGDATHFDGESLIVVGNASTDRLVFCDREPADRSVLWRSYRVEVRFPDCTFSIKVVGDDYPVSSLTASLRDSLAFPTRPGSWTWMNPMADITFELNADGHGHYALRVAPFGEPSDNFRLFVSATLVFDWAGLDRFATLLPKFIGRSLVC